MQELAIANLIAEQEGIWQRQQKNWGTFLGVLGSLAFAVAPLYSTFIHQEYVNYHRASLLMLHCFMSRCVVMLLCNFNKIDGGCCTKWHRQFCTTRFLRMPPLSGPHRVGPWQGYILYTWLSFLPFL